MKAFFLASIFLFFFLNINAQTNPFSNQSAFTSITLLSTKMPIVEGTLNGKKAYFLLDTGSSITLLNLSDKKKYQYKLHRKLTKRMAGFSGNTSSLWGLYSVELLLGDKIIAAPFVGNHLNELKREIKHRTGYEITGIIGSDMMEAYGFIMDYAQRRCLIGVGRDLLSEKNKRNAIAQKAQ